MKQLVLFKHPGLIVHLAADARVPSAKSSTAFLKTNYLSIPLNAAAAEVLVGYLQVMRAFLTNSERMKIPDTKPYEQVTVLLYQKLKSQGKTKADCKDITELIQQMGCLHDWAAGRVLLIPSATKSGD